MLKFSHITPVLKSLHWLKINERIKYKLLSLTYKVLTTHQPQYLQDSISVQRCHNTRSSSMVTLARPPTHSSLKITNRSIWYAAPCLWNELPTDLREPRQTVSCTFSYHTWQLIIFTTVTITACIFSYSLSVSIWTPHVGPGHPFSPLSLHFSVFCSFLLSLFLVALIIFFFCPSYCFLQNSPTLFPVRRL